MTPAAALLAPGALLAPAAFVTAPAADRTLDAGAYLAGAAELGLAVAAIAFGAFRVRAALLPGWSGSPARLVEIVLAVCGLIWVSEIVGTFGGFERGPVIAAAIVAGIATALVAGWAGGRSRGTHGLRWTVVGQESAASGHGAAAARPPAPPSWNVAKLVAAGTCAALAAAWMVPTLSTLASGMDRTDSLWYHLPLAARFVQTGYLGHVYFFDPIFLASFYPANSEVVHALGMLFFHRDLVSPLVNLGWLAVSLLAAWCIGRPYGLGPQALVGASIALGSQSLVEFQAGEALNDIAGVAFVLCAVAILVNGYASRPGLGPRRAPRLEPTQVSAQVRSAVPGHPPPATTGITGRSISAGALVAAGLAAGLAAGTKLSFLAPVGALTVAVIAIAPRFTRLRAAALWIVPTLAAGGYWYVRNLVAVGNPIPYISSVGPITLPAPVRDFNLRPDFAVVHYWRDTDVWQSWFFPGLHTSFGTLWPATLLGMLAVGVFALWRGRDPILRALGGVVLVTAVAYAFTPLTAAGEQGQPIAFTWNLRYLAPAVAVGLAILPCLPALRATPARRAVVLAALSVVLAFTVGSLVQWSQGHVKGAVAAAAVVLVLALLGWALRSRGVLGPAARPRVLAGLAAVAVAVAVVGGYAEQRHYLARAYQDTGAGQDLAGAIRWARDIRGARIAVAGIRGVFTQYPFYGAALDNRVQWLGERGPHDAYKRIPNCADWRRDVDAGGYTHVVTTFDPYLPGTMRNSPEGRWTQSDPNARVIRRDGPVRVFALRGPLDPAGCAGQRPLSRAQLHSVPNLNGSSRSSR